MHRITHTMNNKYVTLRGGWVSGNVTKRERVGQKRPFSAWCIYAMAPCMESTLCDERSLGCPLKAMLLLGCWWF